MSLGSLVVRLGLDAAEFVGGIDAAQIKSEKFAKAVDKAMGAAVAQVGALAVAAGGYLVVADRLVQSLSDYQGLADTMGDTAAQVASLRDAADLSGTAMDQVASASVRLTRTLSTGGKATEELGGALRKIGIDMADFAKQGPAQQLETVAGALGKFEDGAGKTAAAIAIFGKEGAGMVSFLNDLEETGGRNVTLTEEQIAAADEYAKSNARLLISIRSFAEYAAGSVAPVLMSLVDALTAVSKQFLGVDAATARLHTGDTLKGWAESAVSVLTYLLDAANAVARVFDGLGKAIGSLAAQGVAMAKLQFAEAARLRDDYAADAKRLLTEDLAGVALRRQMARDAVARRDAEVGPPTPARGSLAASDFAAPASGSKGKSEAGKANDAARAYIETLNAQIEKQRQATTAEEALRKLQTDRFAAASQSLRDEILARATLVDMAEDAKRVEKEAADLAERRQGIADELAQEAGRIREAQIGPLERTANMIERIRYLEQERYLTTAEADRAVSDAWDNVLAKTEEKVAAVNEFVAAARLNMQNVLGDAIGDLLMNRFDDGIKGMLKRWAEAMARMAAMAAASKIMTYFFGPVAGAAGGAAAGAAAGGRANGGPVFSGQSVLVGERGPEVLTMGGTGGGHITPVAKSSGGPIEINTVVNVNESGTSSQRNGNGAGGEMAGMATMIQQMVSAAVAREMQQGGVIWKRQQGYA